MNTVPTKIGERQDRRPTRTRAHRELMDELGIDEAMTTSDWIEPPDGAQERARRKVLLEKAAEQPEVLVDLMLIDGISAEQITAEAAEDGIDVGVAMRRLRHAVANELRRRTLRQLRQDPRPAGAIRIRVSHNRSGHRRRHRPRRPARRTGSRRADGGGPGGDPPSSTRVAAAPDVHCEDVEQWGFAT